MSPLWRILLFIMYMQYANHHRKSLKILPPSFYLLNDILKVSKQLLGKLLLTNINGARTAGIIVETEAYAGIDDRASHSYNNNKTKRNEAMFFKGGIAYIYLCYGIHNLFNVVTNTEKDPQAVLIRAIEPTIGIQNMLKRRKIDKLSHNLTSGPGKLSEALGLSLDYNKTSLQGPNIGIYNIGRNIPDSRVMKSKRIGVDYAGKDALNLWRFRIKDNPWCSK